MVVCYLHGQTGRFTVWANGKQNSGLANFIPESLLPFVQISSIHPKRPVHGKQPVCVCMCVFPGGLLFVSDQNDRQTESLSGQMVVILGGPLTGRYFKP